MKIATQGKRIATLENGQVYIDGRWESTIQHWARYFESVHSVAGWEWIYDIEYSWSYYFASLEDIELIECELENSESESETEKLETELEKAEEELENAKKELSDLGICL